MVDSWDRIRGISSNLRGLTIIGTSDIAASGISAIFWFYMASLLGAEYYGHVSYFLSIASIASTISLLGSENTISVYTPKKIKIESPIFFIAIISGIITAIIVYFLFYDYGVSAYVLGAVLVGLAGSEVIAKGLYGSYSRYLITQKILMVTLTISLYYLIGVDGVLLGIGLSFFPYTIRIVRGFNGSKIDLSLLKPRIGFMMNSYVLNLSSAFSGSIDKLIIAPLVGFTLLGNYQLGLQFLSMLHIVPSIVYKYILPQDASGNPNKKLKQMTILFSVGLAGLGVIISPLIIPFFFPKYLESIEVIQIMSISIIPATMNLIYTSKFLGSEKVKIILISSGVYLSVLISSLVLLGNAFGINGMAFALVLGTSAETIFYFVVNRIREKD